MHRFVRPSDVNYDRNKTSSPPLTTRDTGRNFNLLLLLWEKMGNWMTEITKHTQMNIVFGTVNHAY